MTLKREKKRELIRKQLMEKEQESTHSLVSKFSKEMITLIQEKELAALVSFIKVLYSFLSKETKSNQTDCREFQTEDRRHIDNEKHVNSFINNCRLDQSPLKPLGKNIMSFP